MASTCELYHIAEHMHDVLEPISDVGVWVSGARLVPALRGPCSDSLHESLALVGCKGGQCDPSDDPPHDHVLYRTRVDTGGRGCVGESVMAIDFDWV